MKNKRLLSLALLIALCLSGCGKNAISCPPASETSIITETEVVNSDMPISPVIGASFADNLMTLTAGDGNRMVSPYSAKMCIAMLANGANGETKQQILSAIGISDIEAYNSTVKETLARYEGYSGVLALNTANSLWINRSTFAGEFLPEYRNKMSEFYSAEVREVTVDNSIEEVNSWASKKTDEKINSILTEEHREFSLALVNAVYFKALWEIPFVEYRTKEADFTNFDGSVSKLDFMNSTDRFGYFEKDGIKAISLEYGRIGTKDGSDFYLADKNYSFSMYFMLCDGELNVEEFLNSNAPFSSEYIKVSIPKFELEYSLQLNDILISLGMVDAFDYGKADLSGLTGKKGLAVNDVLQKTYIKIDENGTEAAAVTAITVDECAIMLPDNHKEFIADKPFYFAIRDNTSGELLFVGRYENGK